MIEAIPHHAQNWIARSARKPGSFGRITIFNRSEHFLDAFRVTTKPATGPPKDSLNHHGEPDD
ncbi:MAG: hypothetical protein DMF37_08660 [Verrucomicrobia bacterium]|nr:MAG: hypothetical protein DMF37_08660 [Verrucomicrobiota bacterium]